MHHLAALVIFFPFAIGSHTMCVLALRDVRPKRKRRDE